MQDFTGMNLETSENTLGGSGRQLRDVKNKFVLLKALKEWNPFTPACKKYHFLCGVRDSTGARALFTEIRLWSLKLN